MLRFAYLLFSLFLSCICAAQDLIQFRNGNEQNVKVLEINPTEVIYKRTDNLEGPTIIVLKSEVIRIVYANGTREEFVEEPPRTLEDKPVQRRHTDSAPKEAPRTDQELYAKGRMDALAYYHNSGPMWGTMAATIYPPAGLVTGIVVGAIPPNPGSFTTPTPELLAHRAYRKGYQAQAHRRKIGKAAAGFGIGLGAYFVAALVIIAAGR